MLERLSG